VTGETERYSASLETLRAKLDRAIESEAWPAVTAIAARIREAERAGVVELAAERAKRSGR